MLQARGDGRARKRVVGPLIGGRSSPWGRSFPGRFEKMNSFSDFRNLVGLLVLGTLTGCFADANSTPTGHHPGGGGSGGGGGGGTDTVVEMPPAGGAPDPGEPPKCNGPVDSSQVLRARSEIVASDVAPTERQILVSDLFARFSSYCGACHVSSNQGGLKVSADDFFTKIDQKALDRIRSTDVAQQMPPPPEVPFASRKDGDPIVGLARDLETWIGKGSPANGFYVPIDGATHTYAMSQELGDALTNIGNCLPNQTLYASEHKEMLERDDYFSSLEALPFDDADPGLPEELLGLPKDLQDTDLVSFDSEALARRGVVAFAPGYPLWSDDAGKLRYVRVPYGESIRFDKKTQQFTIPPNTRFYKTFLKEVTDESGEKRFRKIETRLIVARPDIVDQDGNHTPTALFGTYKWDETETSAQLLGTDGVGGPFRNGHPFADDLFPYLTDEPAAAKIRKAHAKDEYYAEEYEFDKAGIRRHYAIPSSQRCIECHMGSPSESFILGFTPLQIKRRPCSADDPKACAVGGLVEPTGPDELNQLERLIALGVITGIDTPEDVTLLENAEGDRKPRNDQELLAQGYMVGNCAHCHNPNGFPSVTAPELRPLLNFLPSAQGGVFQFPMDRTSPRIKRDPFGKTAIPYITPSLRDLLPPSDGGLYTNKFTTTSTSVEKSPGSFVEVTNYQMMDAPWRSLIFRNTHTPYTYPDDYAIFPHMPLNTPGYDCRVAKIMGDWMVSIPAVRKHPELNESYIPRDPNLDTFALPDPAVDREPQPYVEVRPGEKGYEDALRKAGLRLDAWRKGSAYNSCPDTTDLVDPDVKPGIQDTPADRDTPDGPYVSRHFDYQVDPMDADGVPDHPHWVPTDLTEVRGAWVPRNTNWPQFFVEASYPDPNSANDLVKRRARVGDFVRKMLTDFKLTPELRTFLETKFPLSLWQPNKDCKFTDIPRVSDFTGPDRPMWMDVDALRPGYAKGKAPADAPVFEAVPGAIVFDMICRNCHGREADSKGPLAKTIQDMTGGTGRVANFRTGLFGPTSDPGANREAAFGAAALNALYPPAKNPGRPANWHGEWPGNADDWTVRYMTWMGLGGTEVSLPATALALVARTDVAGVARPIGFSGAGNPNMLTVAVAACVAVLGTQVSDLDMGIASSTLLRLTDPHDRNFPLDPGVVQPLLSQIGDAEFWLQLCSFDNPPPIRVVKGHDAPTILFLADPQAYPEGTLVKNHRGELVPYQVSTSGLPGNLFPYCFDVRDSPYNGSDPHPAFCDASAPLLTSGSATDPEQNKLRMWALKGAANAAAAVFVFLDKLSNGRDKLIHFDECTNLEK